MNPQVPLSLVGFATFERSTIEAFIRTAEARRLRQTGQQEARFVFTSDVAAARIILVDTKSDAAMRDDRIDPARCIYIGASGRPGQLAHLTRPINLAALMKTLDTSTGPVAAAGTPKASAPIAKAATPTVFPLPDRWSGSSHQERTTSFVTSADELASGKAAPKRILVVDDSEVAQRFMANCLGHFGYDVHRAFSGEEALSRVAAEPYAFVFMDVNMPGIDGYQACKLIKKRPYPVGRSAPVVVMLTSRGGVIDKVRGTLSYCDAYLTKPLQLDALVRILGDTIAPDLEDQQTSGPVARSI